MKMMTLDFPKDSINVSSNYFPHVLMLVSVIVFSLLCISSASASFPYKSSLTISIVLVVLVFLFRNNIQIDWMKFKKDFVMIRGAHGYTKLCRSEILDIVFFRSSEDEESLFTAAYKFSFNLSSDSKRIEELADAGFEVVAKSNQNILVYRVSGIQSKEIALRKKISEWEKAKGSATVF